MQRMFRNGLNNLDRIALLKLMKSMRMKVLREFSPR